MAPGEPHAAVDFTVKLNGVSIKWLPRRKTPELFVELSGPGDLSGRGPMPEASRTYRIAPALLRVGGNELEITNDVADGVEFATVNLGLR